MACRDFAMLRSCSIGLFEDKLIALQNKYRVRPLNYYNHSRCFRDRNFDIHQSLFDEFGVADLRYGTWVSMFLITTNKKSVCDVL